MRKPILVLGAGGKTGARVVSRLTARGLPVRAVSRSSAIPFDWTDPSGWGPVVEGVDAVYVCYQPDLAVPGAPEAIKRFSTLAARAGVRRLVLLSGRGEPEAQECEDIVRTSGVEWTIVRCAFFAQNFSESFFADGVRAGELPLPANDTPEPFVDLEDVADVAVAALIEPAHNGMTYDMTGPRLLTFADAAAEIAAGSGRPISLIPVPMPAYAAALRDQHVPEDIVGLITYLFTTILDGRNAKLGDGVRMALGREPRDFSDYVRRTVQAGGWL